MLIYKLTNTNNGKVYIGQTTVTLEDRWRRHLRSKGCIYLHLAIKKHGKDSFSKEIIEYCESKTELNDRERHWIKFYDSMNCKKGYNIKFGTNHTEAVLIKIKKSKEGKTYTNTPLYQYDREGKFIQKFDRIIDAAIFIKKELALKGSKASISANIRHCAQFLNRTSYGFRWKNYNILDKEFEPFYEPKPTPILKSVKAIKDKEVLIFNSVKEASEQTGVCPPNITRSCKRGYRANGYIFSYGDTL
jgi:group I intron endonuclease